MLVEKATEMELPITAERHCDDDSKLTAIINPVIEQKFINHLFTECSVLSVHDEKEMLFLIADNFHEECFSCTRTFFGKYYPDLLTLNLILEGQDNEKTPYEHK